MQKLIVGSMILVCCTLGWMASGMGEQIPAPRGELRIVDTHRLNYHAIRRHVIEHLVEVDKDGTLVPRLATGWRWLDDRTLEMTLRPGVTFHNGEVFDAEIVKLNWEQNAHALIRQPPSGTTGFNYGFDEWTWSFAPGSRLEVVNPQTVRFVFPEPDATALTKLSLIMPITNRQFFRKFADDLVNPASYWTILGRSGPWGTGPYRLVEGFSLLGIGSDRVVLEANQDYWDPSRFPRVQRIIFDHTLHRKEATELVKTTEGRVDLVTEIRPLETLHVAQSPLATVIKNRDSLRIVIGLFNVGKLWLSPIPRERRWRDVRLRQAVNYAINRADLIRYATKGNGVLIPALLPRRAFGYDPALTPYPFDPAKAQNLLREAGYPDGLTLTLIASEDLAVQATVVGKMLEQVGFTVQLQMLHAHDFYRKVGPARVLHERYTWDIALVSAMLPAVSAPTLLYRQFALDGRYDWVLEQPELRRLYAQAVRTLDQQQRQQVIRQMERHIRDQACFLFLYNPIQLFAVNQEVAFVPHASGLLNLVETSVTEQHWSLRKQNAAVPER
jgi:peptide/nickel transport system substrate-binding protein